MVGATGAAASDNKLSEHKASSDLSQGTWGHVSYQYDEMNRVSKQTNADGTFEAYKYDAVGNVRKIGGKDGTQVLLSGPNGDEVASADELGETDKQIYDGEGDTTKESDAANAQTAFAYDDAGNLITVTDALDTPTEYGYDADSNETTTTYSNDGTQTTTADEYNEIGEVSTSIDQSGTEVSVSYDAAGNEATMTQPNGTSIVATFTPEGDVAGIEATANTANPVTEENSYDALGNLTGSTVTTDTSTTAALTEARYDLASRIISLSDRRGVETTFTYLYTDGNLARLGDSIGGDSKATEFEYDTVPRVSEISFGGSALIGFAYDSSGRTATVTAGSLATVYGYDATSRMTTLTSSYATTTLASYTYSYGSRGNITSASEGTATSDYEYDDLSRLVLVTDPDGRTTRYSYDDLGNRTQVKRSSDEASTTYAYSDANELTSQLKATGEYVTYAHDANGNLVLEASDGTTVTTYSYDPLNRLTKVVKPGGDTVTYTYDGFGNRVEKNANGTSTFYAFDPDGNIALEYDADLLVKVRYIRDPDTGQALAMEQAGSLYYFLYNSHGDVRKVVDASGNTVATYSYDEFGIETSSTGTLYNPIRYSGANNAYFDSETGLYKMGARYYKPEVGRWITRDEHKGTQKDTPSRHRYIYCRNNPVAEIDPSGFYSLTRAEWIQSIRDPFGANVMRYTSGMAEDEMRKQIRAGTVSRPYNGSADAFRHAAWSALATQRIGGSRTKKFTDAHETFPGNPRSEKRMDLHNNREGRRIGSRYSNASTRTISRKIVQAKRAGRLIWPW